MVVLLFFCLAYGLLLLAVDMGLRFKGIWTFSQGGWDLLTILSCVALMPFLLKRVLAGKASPLLWKMASVSLFFLSLLWGFFEPEAERLPLGIQVEARLVLFCSLLSLLWISLPLAAGGAHRIRRWEWVSLVVAASLSLLLSSWPWVASRPGSQCLSAGGSGPRPPSIILIVWDTVRRDHVSLYGYGRKTSPYLDSVALSRQVYSRAVAPSSWTLPSHASFFTGLYPREHGAHQYAEGISPPVHDRFQTITEILRERGYQCGGISANFLAAGKSVNLDQGFHYFRDEPNPWFVTGGRFDLTKRIFYKIQSYLPHSWYSPFYLPNRPGWRVTELALEWLDTLDRSRPFFLFLNYMDAHSPYFPPAALKEQFPGFQPGAASLSPLKGFAEPGMPVDHFVSQYDAEILVLDRELKRFEGELKRRDLFDDVLVIVTADHGELFGEHDLLTHASRLYSPAVEVPLVIRFPKGSVVGTQEDIFEIRRLFHLMASQAGVTMPRRIWPWDALCQRYPNQPRRKFNDPFDHLLSLTEYGVYFQGNKVLFLGDEKVEVYRVEEDPEERSDLSSSRPELVQDARRRILLFEDQVPDAGLEPERGPLHRRDLQGLRDLGYL